MKSKLKSIVSILFIGLLSLSSCKKEVPIIPTKIPTGGLILYLPLDGNARDVSGNEFNGFITSSSVIPSINRFGDPGKCYSFNGVDGYIDILDNKKLRLSSTDFTISTWVYENKISDSYISPILSKRNGVSNNSGYIFHTIGNSNSYGSPGILSYQVSGGDDPRANSYQVIPTHQWTHCLITYDFNSNIMKVFIDGILNSISSVPTTNRFSDRNLMIGGDIDGDIFDGKLDDIRIYDRMLSDDEILSLYNE